MLIYFSPVSWHDFDQRPHEYVRAFNRVLNKEVIWVEPYPTRLPKKTDFFTHQVLREIKPIPSWLHLVRPRAVPIEPIPIFNKINNIFFNYCLNNLPHELNIEFFVIGKPSALALKAMKKFKNAKKIYDAMDDFPCFYQGVSATSMAKIESAIVSEIDCLTVSSHYLADKFSYSQKPISLLLNACSEKFKSLPCFQKADDALILGYVGTIAEWFDWCLILKIAADLPTSRIIIIGPLYKPCPYKLPPNIVLLPAITHDQAIQEMCKFDVGLIPFLNTELTRSVDPIKYYEYSACGLTIISTKFGEMLKREAEHDVYLVDVNQDFSFVECFKLTKNKKNRHKIMTWKERLDPFFYKLKNYVDAAN